MATDRATGLFLIATVALACFLGAGCYNAGDVRSFLQAARSPVSGVEYRVLPPDALTISSVRVPEIDGLRTAVRPDGKINLPLLGEVFVADKTPKEIEQIITKAAMKYYEEADATVQVMGYNSRRFYVLGEVSGAGPMPWTGCDTLLDALAKAQPTDQAWPERILVIRGSKPRQGGFERPTSLKYKMTGIHSYEEDGMVQSGAGPVDANDPNAAVPSGRPAEAESVQGPQKMTVNLLAMAQHGDMANNILLRPNDIIYVQMNPIDSFSRGVERITAPVRALTNGLDDAREMQTHWKWIEHNFPPIGSSRTNLDVR